MKRRPTLLVVLDGWGHREAVESNAVLEGAPGFQDLLGRYPHTLLSASGREVGLPLGLMGNSEVGHLNLGAGRVVYQDVTRIDKAIETGEFAANPAIVEALDAARRSGKRLHLCGLVSDGGVHSSDGHLRALLKLAADRELAPDQVLVHAILDGRDTPPRSGDGFVEALERDIASAGVGRIATVIGRYWAMDRDKRWERTAARATSCTSSARATRVDRGDRRRAAPPTPPTSATSSSSRSSWAIPKPPRMDGRRRRLPASTTARTACGRSRWRSASPTSTASTASDGRSSTIATMTQYRADFPFPDRLPEERARRACSPRSSRAHGLTPEAHRRDREVRARHLLLLGRQAKSRSRGRSASSSRARRSRPTTCSRR